MSDRIVIIGAGQAAAQLAQSLDQAGFTGNIRIVGDEPYAPYQRPPLSKAYLLGETDRERLKFRADDYYAKHGIDLRVSTTATGLDPKARRLTLADGSSLAYDKLVLATGARVRPLPVDGAKLDGVFFLKTLDDVDRIGNRLTTAQNVVVIGAGFIGLEFAAVARKLGKTVSVLEAMPRVMARVVTEEMSQFFTELHRGNGVSIHCDTMVTALEGQDGAVTSVTCADGQSFAADLVVVGIGVLPNVELAADAGLACENGIVVDEHGRTSDPHIHAAGDCCAYAHPFAGHLLRLESVQNAADQGRVVAAAIVGHEKSYETVPWFWSDQYDVKLQMVGLQAGCDSTLLRGDLTAGKFSLFHFRGGALRAIDSVNSPADHMAGRKLLAAGISPTPEQASNPDFKLKELLA